MGFFSFLGAKTTNTNHSAVVDYFQVNRLGSQPPVMTILSNLPSKDRCVILAEVLKSDPTNPTVYEKLSMAYLKNNNLSSALSCLENGKRSGNLSSHNYLILKDKIESLNANFNGNFPSSTNYQEALQRIERDHNTTKNLGYDFSEFVDLVKKLCLSNK